MFFFLIYLYYFNKSKDKCLTPTFLGGALFIFLFKYEKKYNIKY